MSKRAIFLGGKRAAGAVADAGVVVGTSPLVAEWSIQDPSVVSSTLVNASPLAVEWSVQAGSVVSSSVNASPLAAEWSVQDPNVMSSLDASPLAVEWSVQDPSVVSSILVNASPLSAEWSIQDPSVMSSLSVSPLVAEWSVQAATVPSPSTFSEVASSDWEGSAHDNGNNYASIPVSGFLPVGNANTNYKYYGMLWDELDVPASATITSASLVFKTTSGGADINARVFVNSDQAVDSGTPADPDAAKAMVDRCGSQWSGSSDIFGGSGAAANTVYTVDVKTIIEDIIGRTGWASNNAITLLLCGVAEDVGSGCQSDQNVTSLQLTYILPLLGNSTDVVLTVVYE